MKKYFLDNVEEFERIKREDFVSDEFGDRRQEIVFIGMGLQEAEIRAALDECLCTDEEMQRYRQQLQNYMDTTLATVASPSLFDVGSIDHMDGQ